MFYLQKGTQQRRGIVIPMLIGVLTVFFILLMAIGQGSTELGRNMSLINHRQHARFMTMAAIEEMHNILWNKLSNPINATSTRNEVIQAVLGGGVYKIDLRPELKHSNKLYTKQQTATTKNSSKATISIFEAIAEFHNFKTIAYSSTGLYSNPNPYYRSPDGAVGGQPAAGISGTNPDFYGWVTYKVKAQHGIVTKQMIQSRPIKIVDMTPMGREYALFEMESAGGASLNEGPGFYIDGNGEGRIRMDGPYYLDVEGGSDGKRIGFWNWDDSVGGLSYPKWIGNPSRWDEDSFIPSPKWVTTCPPWAGTGGGKRLFLKTLGSTNTMIYICSCCLALPIIPIDLVGQYLLPTSQEYISASIPEGEQTFSLTGQEGDRQFKGLVYAEGADYASPQGVTEDWDPDKGMEIRHEGIIIGKYKTYTSTRFTFCPPPVPIGPVPTYFCITVWNTKDGPEIQQIYALKGDERPDVDWMAVGISTLFDVASGMTMGAGAAAAQGGMAVAGAVGKELGKQMLFQIGMQKMAGGLDPSGVPTPQDITGVFPSGFRMINRAAVRHVNTMDEAMWKKGQLLFDGVTWVDDLNTKVRDIEYIGKGTIASFATDFAKEQTIPEIKAKDETKDFMNLWFMGGPQGAFLNSSGDYLQLSLFASNGLNPKKDLLLLGNYMTGTIRKAEIENRLDLMYWPDRLYDPSREDYQKDFRIISMSPKIESISEVVFKLNKGVGEDGVEAIVSTIGD